jgi:hypothetical protein
MQIQGTLAAEHWVTAGRPSAIRRIVTGLQGADHSHSLSGRPMPPTDRGTAPSQTRDLSIEEMPPSLVTRLYVTGEAVSPR